MRKYHNENFWFEQCEQDGSDNWFYGVVLKKNIGQTGTAGDEIPLVRVEISSGRYTAFEDRDSSKIKDTGWI